MPVAQRPLYIRAPAILPIRGYSAGSILKTVVKSTSLKSSKILGVLLAAFLLASCSTTSTDAGDGGKGKGKGKGKNAGGGAVPVEVAKTMLKSVPVDISVVGNVEAYSVVSIRAQTGGMLNEVRFKDGDYVKKGDLLFVIDRKPLEGQMNSARANLAKSTALLKQAQAQLLRDTASANYARDQAERYQKGVTEGVFAKEQAEQLKSSAAAQMQILEADRAAIGSAEAQISADQSAINNLNIQLGYTTVEATIDGRSGNILQKAGNIITANTTELATLYQVEPIYVTFSVPEARLADVKRYSENNKLAVTARAQDGTGDVEQGELSFIDNSVDTSTGTIKLKGTFQNKSHKLWPGQFVNVGLRLTMRNNAVVVPNQAVQTGQDGTYVYVVGEDRAVTVVPVKTGPRIDQDMVIEAGLKGGETVVTEGQLRLQPGSKVQVRGDQQTGDGRPRSAP